MKNKRAAAAAAAVMMMLSSSCFITEAEETVEISKNILEKLNDENGDNVKDISDLKLTENLRINLEDTNSIDFLRYAESCRYLQLSGGDIKDFSVLKEMKNLRYLSMSGMTVENLSFLENTNIVRVSFSENTEIKKDEAVNYFRAEDYVIPAGQLANIGVYPVGIIDAGLVIKDSDIIGFGEYGDIDKSDIMEGIVHAMKPGETEYSLVADGKVLKTGRIKVVPSDIQDFPLEEDIIRTVKINSSYYNGESYTFITNSDDSLWRFDGREYIKTGENVKLYQSEYSSYGNPFYVLQKDGKLTLNGDELFDKDTVVTDFYSSYYSAWAVTEKHELWYIQYVNGETKKILITDDCIKFNHTTNAFLDSESKCTFVKMTVNKGKVLSWKKYPVEIEDVKTVAGRSYRLCYLLNGRGELYKAEITDNGSPVITKLRTGVSELGYLVIKADAASPAYLNNPVYKVSDTVYTADGDRIDLTGKNAEMLSPEEYEASKKDTYENIPVRDISFIPYNSYDFVPSKFEGEFVDGDFTHMYSYRDKEKNEYISFLGRYGAVSNSEFSYGTETDGDDYIVLVVRTDGSLWEYHVADQKFIRKDFGKISSGPADDEPPADNPVPVYSAADVIKIQKYFYGEETEPDSRYDFNSDGTIGIIDLILLKCTITEDFLG